MAYNGSGTFVINTAGQPVVPNTVISATAFNALTADLANGLSTCITKDGQTTPTANIPMGNNKITGLAPGTSGTDAANLSQVQGSTAKLLQSVTGTDTITAAMVPALTAYAAGQMFYFVAAGDNTGAVTINIDSLGAKSVTRDGSTALVAGDITNGKVVVIVYDGTRFQLLNSNAFTNLYVSGNLGVGNNTPAYKFHVERPSYGITGYFYANDGTRNPRLVVYGSSSGTTIQHTFSTAADSLIFAVGGSIGAGTEVARFVDGGNFGIGTANPQHRLDVVYDANATSAARVSNSNLGTSATATLRLETQGATWTINNGRNGGFLSFNDGGGERARFDNAGNFGIGTASPTHRLHVATAGNNYIVSQRTTANTSALLLGAESGGTSIYSWTTVAGSTGVPLNFYTGASPSMTLDASGALGIGTSSPVAKLSVQDASVPKIALQVGGTERAFLLYTESTFTTRLDSDGPIELAANNAVGLTISTNRNVSAGVPSLATTATDGFLYVPTCAGTPTGTPTAITGMAPIVVNTTNNKLYFYSGGAWRDAGP